MSLDDIPRFVPQEFFPVPIWARILPDFEGLNSDLCDHIVSVMAETPNTPRSSVGGWQSPRTLQNDRRFEPIRAHIARHSIGCAKVVGFDFGAYDLVISEMWANETSHGQFHRAHTHPNRFLSGVYYISVPDMAGDLIFDDPVAARVHTPPPVTTDTPFYPTSVRITPVPGMIVLFPSWLSHSVGPTPGPAPRRSLSFNISYRPH